jgi:hypothetical protein
MGDGRGGLAEGTQRLRGEVAADPGLLEDEARFRRAAGEAARDLEPDDEAARQSLEGRLVAMRSELREAGS